MAFKINVSHKGKTLKFEVESEELVGTKIGDKIDGGKIDASLEGYEIEICGTSDKAGFPGFKEHEGPGLKRVLLTYGKGMRKKPKREKHDPGRPRGVRMRKTIRGNEISLDTVQINCKVVKEGGKSFEELGKSAEAPAEGEKSAETPKEEVKEEVKSEEKPEEKKEEAPKEEEKEEKVEEGKKE